MESNRVEYQGELTSAYIERMQNPDDASKLCVEAELCRLCRIDNRVAPISGEY
jgi:hypothetical protein